MVTLDHLIVKVNDREASVCFYTEVMGFMPFGDSFHSVGNMEGPGEEAGARGLGPTLYLFDPNGHLVELRHY